MKKITSEEAYFTVNIILAGVILLIMGYSVFYSPAKNNYPVVCVHEKLTGLPCPSCGLSHAFSLIVRGRVEEALEWNQYSVRVFLFFLIQLVLRISLAAYIYTRNPNTRIISSADAVISAVMAIAAFYPFFIMEWRLLL